MLPPDKPSIEIGNYLLKLRDDIKIWGGSKILYYWYNKEFDSFLQAAKVLKISESFCRYIIQGKRPIPIWLLKRFNRMNSEICDEIFDSPIKFTARSEKETLPKNINPKIAYYLGFLQGDGHVDRNGKRITFSEGSRKQLKLINEINKSVFNFRGSLYEKFNKKVGSRTQVLDLRRVTLNSFVSDIIGLRRGRKVSMEIPEIFLRNKQILKWYLTGLFDAEGAMPIKPKKKRDCYIDIAMKDKKLIEHVKEVLVDNFGISSYGPYKRIAKSKISGKITEESELRIRKQSEIVKFMNEIGTIHPNKIKRKEIMINLLGPVAQLG